MPEYRDIKKPTALIGSKLTAADQVTVDTGGIDASIGISEGVQLDIWHRNNKTLVRASGTETAPWSFKGYINPFDCREWYLATVPVKADPAT